MAIRKRTYFAFALFTLGLMGIFMYIRDVRIFHIFFALTIFLCIRTVFNRVTVLLVGVVTFAVLVSLTLFAAFGSLFFAMTKELDELYYINDTASYISRLYYFRESSIYTYIATIFGVSCLEIVLQSPMKVKRFILPSILACLLFFITSAVFNNSVTTVYYDFQSDKTYGSSEIKIVHISDTHSTIYPNNQLAEKIKEQNPDIILMTGDIAEDIMPFEGTEILLKQIKDIAPIYYVTGNHEYAAADFEEANEKIQSYGVHYLDDDYQIITIQGNKILVAGVNDPLSKKVKQPYIKMPERLETLSEQYKKTGFKGLKILLSHRPELHEMYAAQDYDFVLSGHAHGGQARIPYLLNGLVAPNQGYFPKYAGGVYALPNDSNTKLIVSRGLSLDALPRIFNPPELVVITITGTR